MFVSPTHHLGPKDLLYKALIISVFLFTQGRSAFSQLYSFERYSFENGRLPENRFGGTSPSIKSLECFGDSVFLGTYGDGLIKIWREEFPRFARLYSDNTRAIDGYENYSLSVFQDSLLFFTDENSFSQTYNGLFTYRLKSGFITPFINSVKRIGPDNDTSRPLFPRVHQIFNQNDSQLYFATDSGLIIYDGISRWKRFNKNNSTNILTDFIENVVVDSKGAIYLSSGSFIYRRIDQNWEAIDISKAPYKLRNSEIKKLRVSRSDSVWAITNQGVIKFTDDSFDIWLNKDIKPLLNEVKDVAFDSLDQPWMIFENNGGLRFLYSYEGDTSWQQVNSTNSNIPDELSAIQINRQGDVYFASEGHGLFKFLDIDFTSVRESEKAFFSIFPNPVAKNAKAQVTNLSTKPILSIDLVDVQGKVRPLILNANNEVSFNEYASGIYLLRIKTSSGIYHKKLLIN